MFSLFIKRERKRERERKPERKSERNTFKDFFEKGGVLKDYFCCLVNQKLTHNTSILD